MQSDSIIGTRVDAIDYSSAGLQIVDWVRSGKSQYVCVANVHMVMEAYDHPDFQVIVNSAGLVTPDGMPLVWLMRLRGRVQQERVYGPTLMLKLLETADREGVPVGFYGGKPDALESLVKVVHGRYPNLKMVFTFSPPFHELSSEEDANIVERIRTSGARILFVGLGCPKQERWMAAHSDLPMVKIGVGAAFDFLSGSKPQAPSWIQKIGLEWLFRLIQEPRRLWRRYLIYNPRFMALVVIELLGWRRSGC